MGISRRTLGVALAAYEPDPSMLLAQLESIVAQRHAPVAIALSLDPGPRIQNWDEVWAKSPELRAFKESHAASAATHETDRLAIGWHVSPHRLGVARNFAYAARQLPPVDAIAFSDQDDIWHPDKLLRNLDRLNACPPLSAVHSDMWVWDGVADRTEALPRAWALERRGVEHVSPADLCIRNVVAGAGMLIDAALVREHLEIPEAFAFHDHWFAAIAALHGGVYSIPEPLYWYRQHAGGELGVTPYAGMLTRLTATGSRLPAVARSKWAETYSSALALSESLPTPSAARALDIILQPHHRVSRLIRWGTQQFQDHDPALARAIWIRALGSALS